MSILLACFLLQVSPSFVAEDLPLPDPLGLAWDPATGHVAVLHHGGATLQIFDFQLRPISVLKWESPQSGLSWTPEGWDFSGPLRHQVPGPAGRTLFLSSQGELSWGLTLWEHDPRIEWGPGWATLRLRSAWLTRGTIEWRPKSALQGNPGFASLQSDPLDPLSLRAPISGLVAGADYEIRVSVPRPQYPLRRMGPWISVTVPKVDPAGPRPQTWLVPAWNEEGDSPLSGESLPVRSSLHPGKEGG